MTMATEIQAGLVDFLGDEVEAQPADSGRVAVLTPAEYPDGDGVVVWVAEAAGDAYEVSDLGETDARMAGRGLRAAPVRQAAEAICRRFDLDFRDGTITAKTRLDSVAEACWRVAQAASAIAEAPTFRRSASDRERALVENLEREIRGRSIEVRTDAKLEGASGHKYTPALFVPGREVVIEPVTGERAWNKASAVYVEFGDLGRANGYELVAVVDDREEPVEEVEGLLSQVAAVARWSRRTEWLDTIARRRFP
jgi:hypothetical protein